MQDGLKVLGVVAVAATVLWLSSVSYSRSAEGQLNKSFWGNRVLVITVSDQEYLHLRSRVTEKVRIIRPRDEINLTEKYDRVLLYINGELTDVTAAARFPN